MSKRFSFRAEGVEHPDEFGGGEGSIADLEEERSIPFFESAELSDEFLQTIEKERADKDAITCYTRETMPDWLEGDTELLWDRDDLELIVIVKNNEIDEASKKFLRAGLEDRYRYSGAACTTVSMEHGKCYWNNETWQQNEDHDRKENPDQHIMPFYAADYLEVGDYSVFTLHH